MEMYVRRILSCEKLLFDFEISKSLILEFEEEPTMIMWRRRCNQVAVILFLLLQLFDKVQSILKIQCKESERDKCEVNWMAVKSALVGYDLPTGKLTKVYLVESNHS